MILLSSIAIATIIKPIIIITFIKTEFSVYEELNMKTAIYFVKLLCACLHNNNIHHYPYSFSKFNTKI